MPASHLCGWVKANHGSLPITFKRLQGSWEHPGGVPSERVGASLKAWLRAMRPAAAVAGRDAGFTLLEVLVSLVVTGLILAGLAQGFRFGVAAWDAQTRILASAATSTPWTAACGA